jgi:hypothetical protein
MIIYRPGFARLYVDEPDPAGAAKAEPNHFPEGAHATEPVQARQSQVLGYTRTAGQPAALVQNLRQDGPTLEEWMKAGYEPQHYPPVGYAEKPSEGLDAFKQLQATLSGQKTPHSVTDKPEVT